MSSTRLTRIRTYPRAVALLVFTLALATPAVAHAATVWSNHQPAPLSATTNTAPAISVVVDDDFTLYPMSTLKIDGVYTRSKFKLISYADPTKAIITAQAPTLADGPHTVFVDVPRQAGMGHITHSWTFTVGAPPTVSEPAPEPDSRIGSATPLVQARVTDTGPIASVTVAVDGTNAPATFANGIVSAPVTVPLANDQTHTARVVATDGAGLVTALEWEFYVQTLPAMPVTADCAECHVGYPLDHPVDDCASCHGEGSPVGGDYDNPWDSHAPGTRCSDCHGDLSDCEECHGQSYATVPELHDLVDDAYHESGVDGCSPCHAKRLTDEHYQYGLDCMTCHGSSDPIVQQAIANGTPSCFACHSGGHEELHESTLEPSCAECHESNLIGEHVDRGLACAACHESADPAVIDAIAAGDTSCVACHGVAGHEAQHESPIDTPCEACHEPNLVGEHLGRPGYTCATCHESTDPGVIDAIIAGDTECAACHDLDSHPYVPEPHASDIGSQTLDGSYPSGASYSVACTDCHAEDLGKEHSRSTSSSSASSCAACHPSPRDTLDPWAGSCVQAGCHPSGGPFEQHAAMDIDHLVPSQYASCTACHNQGDAAAIHTASDSSCAACHSDTTLPTHLDCGICHPAQLEPHGFDTEQHTASVANSTISGVLVGTTGAPFYFSNGQPSAYSGQTCGQCHSMDIYAEHTKAGSVSAPLECGACHPSPRNTFASWDTTCQQGGCHASYHTDMATKHHYAYSGSAASCGGADSSCHPGEWVNDLAAIHNEQAYWGSAFGFDFGPYPNGCTLCHGSSAVPTTPTGCNQCHVDPHWVANLP